MATTIVCLRHAKPTTEGYASDSLCPLSEEGRNNQKSLCKILEARKIQPTTIFTSPLVRAVQTGEILGEYFNAPIIVEEALGIHFNRDVLIDRIPEPQENSTIFFVGHAPTLAEFVNTLVGTRVVNGLSKSSAAIIEFNQPIAFGQGTFVDYIKL